MNGGNESTRFVKLSDRNRSLKNFLYLLKTERRDREIATSHLHVPNHPHISLFTRRLSVTRLAQYCPLTDLSAQNDSGGFLMTLPSAPVRVRCDWCGDDPLYVRYHDEEWGVPVHDDNVLFEFLVLEGAQAGLSWLTILRRREH